MPGYVNYFYKDEVLPTHTKPGFKQFNILTTESVIAKNAMIFMHKVKKFTCSIPSSVSETIASDAPAIDSDHETCHEWLAKYGTSTYAKSIFYK